MNDGPPVFHLGICEMHIPVWAWSPCYSLHEKKRKRGEGKRETERVLTRTCVPMVSNKNTELNWEKGICPNTQAEIWIAWNTEHLINQDSLLVILLHNCQHWFSSLATHNNSLGSLYNNSCLGTTLETQNNLSGLCNLGSELLNVFLLI
jgi:hypothetical protein